MKNILALTLLLAMLFLGAMSAEAANRYVRAGASGSANGTDWTNAYTTLPATLTRGDTYYIADGNYGRRVFSTAVSGTTRITIKKATVADHGTDTGWSDAFGSGQATFTGFSFTTSYWTVDGMTGGGPGSWRTGFGFQINYPTSNPGVAVNGVTGITLRHLAVIGPHPPGSGGSASTDGLFFRNTVGSNADFTISYYYLDNLGLAPFSAIPIASVAGSNFIAEYGYIGAFYGTGDAHSEIASMWAGIRGTVTFRYNIFGYVFSTGGLMWDNNEDHNARLEIYGNVFWRDPTLAGYSNCCNGLIGGWTSNSAFFNVHVINNTFVNIPGAEVLSTFPQVNGNNEARNNLFYATNKPGGGGVWQTVTHNHFISTSPIGTSTSTSVGNPFVDMTNLNFALTAATPAGVTLSAPYNTDMFGKVRGADGGWDRGAIEFTTGGADATPPAAPINVRIQ